MKQKIYGNNPDTVYVLYIGIWNVIL